MTKTTASNLEDYVKAGGNPDSAANQRIRDRLVEREVLHCCSSLVSFCVKEAELIGTDCPSTEDILDLCERRHDHSERIEEIEDEISDLEDEIVCLEEYEEAGDSAKADTEDKLVVQRALLAKLEAEKEQLEEEQDNPSEVYEHWAVTNHFAEKLKEHGETVGELFDFTIWGRITTGQMISMDHVVAEIAASMEILEGQEYSWKEGTES